MAEELIQEAEQMLRVFTDYLNALYLHEEAMQVFREMFDGDDDPPRVLADMVVLEGYLGEFRIISVICDPYHDEGGPNVLTGFFARDADDNWDLHSMLQDFDTNLTTIYQNKELIQ